MCYNQLMKKNNIPSIIAALHRVGTLKTLKRHGWLLKGISNPESVADHTFRMCLIALFLPSKYLDNINLSKLLIMILIHDLGEAKIGDIKWESGKRILSSQAKKHADEEIAVKEIFSELINKDNLLDTWREFNAQQTPESKLAKQIDKLEMVIQAYEYEKAGHSPQRLQEFWDNVEKYLTNNSLQPFLDYLKLKRREHKGNLKF